MSEVGNYFPPINQVLFKSPFSPNRQSARLPRSAPHLRRAGLFRAADTSAGRRLRLGSTLGLSAETPGAAGGPPVCSGWRGGGTAAASGHPSTRCLQQRWLRPCHRPHFTGSPQRLRGQPAGQRQTETRPWAARVLPPPGGTREASRRRRLRSWLSAETEGEPADRGGKGLLRASSRADAGCLGRLGVNPGSSAARTSPDFSAWPLTSSGGELF